MRTIAALLAAAAAASFATPAGAQTFWNRGVHSIGFAAPDDVIVITAHWSVEAADPASYDLGTDVQFFVNGALVGVNTRSIGIATSGACPGSTTPCDNSVCGSWIIDGASKTGLCAASRTAAPQAPLCVCESTLTDYTFVTPDLSPGDVVEVRLVPRPGTLVDTYACDDSLTTIFSGVCNVQRYCTAKPSSCGTLPQIRSNGLASATASCGFVLRGTRARKDKTGILLYTDQGPDNRPFQGGTLCVESTGLRRSVPVVAVGGSSGAACESEFVLDWNAFASGALGGNPAAYTRVLGTRISAQWWGRDSPAHGSYLSDALHFIVCS